VRKLGIGSDELPRLDERGIDEFSDFRVETCLPWHQLLPYTFDFLSHEKPCQSSTEAHAALPNIAAPPCGLCRIVISNGPEVRCSGGAVPCDLRHRAISGHAQRLLGRGADRRIRAAETFQTLAFMSVLLRLGEGAMT
jgi:hypothetical protein